MATSIFQRVTGKTDKPRLGSAEELTKFIGEQTDPAVVKDFKGLTGAADFGFLSAFTPAVRDALAVRREQLADISAKQEARRKALGAAGKRFGAQAARGGGAFGGTINTGDKKVLLGGTR